MANTMPAVGIGGTPNLSDSQTFTITVTEPLPTSGGISDPTLLVQPANLPLQPVGVPFVDPVFGTTLRRVSDTSERGGFETQIYNQLQAFSSDNAYLLLTGSNGYIVRRVGDLSQVAGLDSSPWNAPRWHPAQPHVLVHFDSNDDTVVRLQFTDVDTLTTSTVFTFPAQYQHVRVNESFDELSEDGRWMAGMLTRADGASVLFTLDLQNLTLGAELSIPDLYTTACQPDPHYGAIEPDWIGVSPLGNYMVVQWVRDGITRCSGLETFEIQTGAFTGRVSPNHHHGDLGVDSDGVTEIFMTTELFSPADNNRPATAIRQLPGSSTESPPTYLQVVDWTDEDHISMQGPHGVGLVSWGRYDGVTNDFPLEDELFLQYTDGSVLRLTHHRSSKCGYWVQPRASMSRDGRYVVFASDWGQQTGTNSCSGGEPLGRGDPYLIDLVADDPPRVIEVLVQGTAPGSWAEAGLSPYAIPVGSAARRTTLPWSNIDEVIIRFSEDVVVDQNAVSLRGIDVTKYMFLPDDSTDTAADDGFRYDTTTFVATWTIDTLATPLAADRLSLELNAGPGGVADPAGNRLDADGDGVGGDNFQLSFSILPGDVNADGAVNFGDALVVLNLLPNPWSVNPRADVNADGVINFGDALSVLNRVPDELPSGAASLGTTVARPASPPVVSATAGSTGSQKSATGDAVSEAGANRGGGAGTIIISQVLQQNMASPGPATEHHRKQQQLARTPEKSWDTQLVDLVIEQLRNFPPDKDHLHVTHCALAGLRSSEFPMLDFVKSRRTAAF